MVDRIFVATKAFIERDGKILLVKESEDYEDGSNAGKYDVVGGRVAPGERFDESLIREVKEETGLDVSIGKPFFVSEWRPVIRGEEWQIIGIFFECEAKGEVSLGEDHTDYIWVYPEDHKRYETIENLAPAFEAYSSLK